MHEPGKLIVLSGPSGAGKTSIVRVLKEDPRIEFSVSATTRSPRPGEVDGVDYHFMAIEEFVARRDRGEFLEWAEYNERFYGTLRAPVDQALRGGKHFVLEIEVQGTQQLRDAGVEALFVFIVPPSLQHLRDRLAARGQNSAEDIERRVRIAAAELEAQSLYDHVVVNRDLEEAIAEVKALLGFGS